MGKLLVTRWIGDQARKILDEAQDVELVQWESEDPPPSDWVVKNVQGVQGILCLGGEKMDKEVLDAAGDQLKILSTMSVGYDHVDVAELAKRKVRLGYTPNVLNDAVADIATMLALMATRQGRIGIHTVDDGEWSSQPFKPFGFCGTQISTPGTTVGFLGFGRIAQVTLRRLAGFGISDVLYTTRSSELSRDEHDKLVSQHSLRTLERVSNPLELAKKSDLIIILTPGGKETYHLVNAEFLSKCKKTATIVNVARGSVVDSDALAQALAEERIWSAGLDVVEGEPNIPKDHPLLKQPRCVIVPHVGSATYDTRNAMATTATKNAVLGLRGEPLIFEASI